VTGLSNGNTGNTYEYDENGNMTCRVEDGKTYIQAYNAENRMSSALLVSGDCDNHGSFIAGWGFTYDGDGNRVKQVYTDGSGSLTTYYFAGGAYEVRSDGTTLKYYAFAGQTIAMRSCTGGTCSAPDYFLTDHLGSVVAVTDASGALISQQRYLPFGQVRTDMGTVSQTDFGYTFQRNMDAQGNQYSLGLMDYRARFYSPSLGRFTQPDTLVPGAGNSQGLDRYMYVFNNPLSYNDPSGHLPRMCRDDERRDRKGNCVPDDATPSVSIIQDLPINDEDIEGVQWFGGTQNAYSLAEEENDIYKYCHYFHCGLDILAPYGTSVTAGVYGQVIYAGCNAKNHEGPCKVQIQVGDYVITYGHLSGIPNVVTNDFVNPNTLLGGVGSNSKSSSNPNFPDPSVGFAHLHLEIRGPRGWAGPSVNPLLFMGEKDIATLVNVAEHQTSYTDMAVFHGKDTLYQYPPPVYLMPNQIWRTTEDISYFP
jgi:RHS repeat-associated protein